jgi:hypothetical protein
MSGAPPAHCQGEKLGQCESRKINGNNNGAVLQPFQHSTQYGRVLNGKALR